MHKRRGARRGVGHGAGDREAGRGKEDREEGAFVHLLLRRCHRRLLGVLLPGAPGRSGRRGGTHRQAERACDGGVLLFCIRRKS